MRVRVYIDSFNRYYRALTNSDPKWWDSVTFSASLIDPDDTVDLVRYFTARISSRAGNPSAPARQQAYLSALHTLPNLRVHYGRFLAKTKVRPLTTEPNVFPPGFWAGTGIIYGAGGLVDGRRIDGTPSLHIRSARAHPNRGEINPPPTG